MPEERKIVNPYKESELEKKTQVRNMFNKIAPFYDFLNRFLSLGIDTLWRKKAIRLLRKDNVKDLLDVATGTADLAIEAAKQLKSDRIVGLDIAEEMLRIGRKKVDKRQLSDRIELVTGDSESLPFENFSFDAVTAAFGVRNFENLEKGLSEMYRVLRPGGKMVVLEFSKPTVFPFKQFFNLYFKHILPVIGRVKSKDPRAYKYLYESVQVFPDYDNFVAVLNNLGFKNCKWKALSLGICCIYSAEK